MRRRYRQLIPMNGRGLTLAELLAVVVLLGLVMALGAPRLASSAGAAEMTAFEAAWRDLDAKARLLARSGQSGVTLWLALDQRALVLCRGEDERVSSAAVPPGMTVALVRSREQHLTAITFDARGCSPDYALRLGDVNGHLHRTWRVAGLTGWIERDNGEDQR